MTELLPLTLLGAVLGLDVVSFPQAMLSRPIVSATLAGALVGEPAPSFVMSSVASSQSLPQVPQVPLGVPSALLERRPFQPFVIELMHGPRFEVDNPRAIAMRDGIAFYFAPGGVPHWFDHDSVSCIIGDTAATAMS